MQFLNQCAKIVFGTAPANYTGSASTSDIVSLKNYDRATVIIQTGAWAGGTAAVTLKQASDVSATGAKALAFTRQFTNVADTTSDTLTDTTVTSNTFNLSAANAIHVIEVKATDLDMDNDFDCLRVDVASPGSNNDLYSVIIVLHGSRFAGANPASAIVD